MRRENLEEFLKFIAENEEHRTKVNSFGSDADEAAAYAQKLGYDVSPDELRECWQKSLDLLWDRASGKLGRPADTLSSGAGELLALMKLAEDDEETSERLLELATGAPEALIAFGKEKGFSFNERDIQAVGEDILEPSDELSDEDLEMAAGGTTVLLFVGILAFGAFALGTAGVAVAVAFAVSKKKG